MALVKYNGKNVLGIGLKEGITTIMPGINEIADETFNLIKLHPLFNNRVAKGLVQIIHDSLGKDTKDAKKLPDDMLEMIPNIFDLKLLKKLIDTDGRPAIVKAAQQQLDNIRNPAKAKAEQSDEHFK